MSLTMMERFALTNIFPPLCKQMQTQTIKMGETAEQT